MRILVAEDDPTSRAVLQAVLEKQGHEVIAATDGLEAWDILQKPESPKLVILDWMMPGLDGIDVCRRVRSMDTQVEPYVVFLTTLSDRAHIVSGLDAGANDYVVKPFDHLELRARVATGQRMIQLQERLVSQANELREALAQVKTLRSIIPICCVCKKVRDDSDYWQSVEMYVSSHTDAQFSHGFCPECLAEYYRKEMGEDDEK